MQSILTDGLRLVTVSYIITNFIIIFLAAYDNEALKAENAVVIRQGNHNKVTVLY